MSATKRPSRLLLPALLLLAFGCGTSTPYFLVESRLIRNQRDAGGADVTETPEYRSLAGMIRTVGLQPPDVCADQGKTASGGDGRLQREILRTRCGVEMAEFERALTRAGFRVVSWGAVQQLSRNQEKSLLGSARALGIDVLLQVNALERIDIQPGRDARIERRFYRATRHGERTEPASVAQAQAREFERIIGRREDALAAASRVAATINVSAVSVESGATIWFYEATEIDSPEADSRLAVLVDCDGDRCIEVTNPTSTGPVGPVSGSISGVSLAGDPTDEAQAIFHDLLRRLAIDLAERLAGHRP
ncbi:MAG TPA: hypothetical protein ENI85_16275 [Deltaproteobacteria bacterium]|nr:hypothetical protein [Deltaproteobacteria bacterium]